MKKFLSIVVAALAVCSCSKNNDEPEVPGIGTEFAGLLTCSVRGTDYPTEGIKASVEKDDVAGTVTITMYEVQFVPQMPVKMTFKLGPVACTTAKDGSVSFSSAEDLIPYNDLASYESYAVSGFTGTVTSEKLSLSMTFATPLGAAPTTYEGSVVK